MNWELLRKILPIAFKAAKEIYDGLKSGASNEEIRQRVASPSVILDDELDDLRSAEDDLEDYIKTGG